MTVPPPIEKMLSPAPCCVVHAEMQASLSLSTNPSLFKSLIIDSGSEAGHRPDVLLLRLRLPSAQWSLCYDYPRCVIIVRVCLHYCNEKTELPLSNCFNCQILSAFINRIRFRNNTNQTHKHKRLRNFLNIVAVLYSRETSHPNSATEQSK